MAAVLTRYLPQQDDVVEVVLSRLMAHVCYMSVAAAIIGIGALVRSI